MRRISPCHAQTIALRKNKKNDKIAPMRIVAFFTMMGSILLLGNCQQTFAGNTYRRTGTPVIHTQTPIPNQATSNYYNSASNPLIPTRPLAQPAQPAPKPKWAKAVCVMDPRTGRVLYGYNENVRRQVASTQKIITALCICDVGDMDHLITIKKEDREKTGKTWLTKISPGEQYTRGAMLRAMLTGSFNNVAYALARDAAGSEDAFATRMNARARRMKMHNSHFANPHGLPGPQYSTARDMAIAGCYAYVNPIIRTCVDATSYNFILNDGETHTMGNTNKLLLHPDLQWVNGMKTGYTNAAGHCLVSSGSLNGRAVVVVILGCPNRPSLWKESERYLRWAMNM